MTLSLSRSQFTRLDIDKDRGFSMFESFNRFCNLFVGFLQRICFAFCNLWKAKLSARQMHKEFYVKWDALFYTFVLCTGANKTFQTHLEHVFCIHKMIAHINLQKQYGNLIEIVWSFDGDLFCSKFFHTGCHFLDCFTSLFFGLFYFCNRFCDPVYSFLEF